MVSAADQPNALSICRACSPASASASRPTTRARKASSASRPCTSSRWSHNFGAGASFARARVRAACVVGAAAGTDATPEANVLRELRTVNGASAEAERGAGCLDPKPVSLDPLSFLLPHHQREYTFSYKGNGRTNGRAVVMIDYGARRSPPPEITWRDTCVSINVPTRTTGRVWIDTATGDVLRIDERVRSGRSTLTSPRRSAAKARPLRSRSIAPTRRFATRPSPSPIRTKLVLLPESIESMTVVRGAGAPRHSDDAAVHRLSAIRDRRARDSVAARRPDRATR